MAETVVQYREEIARGAATVRAQADRGDAGQSSTEEAAQLGAEGEIGRGSEERATRPDAGEVAG